jgi:hypothetical protein
MYKKLALEAVQETESNKMGSIRQRKWSYNSRKINKTKFIAKDFTNGDTKEVVFFLQKPTNGVESKKKEL